jgi:dipeptidyl aminopeptidase/acylaminoacyl peptidase
MRTCHEERLARHVTDRVHPCVLAAWGWAVLLVAEEQLLSRPRVPAYVGACTASRRSVVHVDEFVHRAAGFNGAQRNPRFGQDRECCSYRTMDASPDGKRIAVTVDVGDHRELRLLDIAHAASMTWPAPPTQNMHEPRWSPDGTRIAVLANERAKPPFLPLLHPDDATHVDTVCQCAFNPHAWSPDGREIAGTANRNQLTALVRVSAQAHSTVRDAAAFGGAAWYQSFSPDGHWYTFTGDDGTYLVENRAGSVPTRIGAGGDAAWSPDGRHIAYITSALPERRVMDIPVTLGARPTFGAPVKLFAAPGLVDVAGQDIHFTPDGRILFIESTPVRRVMSMDVVTNWRAEYARKRPGGK